jgi:hypothetical protein
MEAMTRTNGRAIPHAQMPAPAAGRHLLVSVISYAPAIHNEVTSAINAAIGPLTQMGWNVSTVFRCGEADLCRVRNAMVAAFHGSPATDMLCVDADVSWPEGTVERIMSWPVDLVFGSYPQRADRGHFPVRGYFGPETVVDPATGEPREDGLIACDGGPAGFMRITKRCADLMIRAYEHRWYEEGIVPVTGKAYSLFEFTIRGNKRRSEDIEFCKRWTDLGEKCWVDPWLQFTHHGTKDYKGCFGTYLQHEWDKARTDGTLEFWKSHSDVLAVGPLAPD